MPELRHLERYTDHDGVLTHVAVLSTGRVATWIETIGEEGRREPRRFRAEFTRAELLNLLDAVDAEPIASALDAGERSWTEADASERPAWTDADVEFARLRESLALCHGALMALAPDHPARRGIEEVLRRSGAPGHDDPIQNAITGLGYSGLLAARGVNPNQGPA